MTTRTNTTTLVTLSLLENKNIKVNELREQFKDIGGISTGTFYPQLKKMQDNGLIIMQSEITRELQITKKGRAELLVERTNFNIIYGFLTNKCGLVTPKKNITAKKVSKSTIRKLKQGAKKKTTRKVVKK